MEGRIVIDQTIHLFKLTDNLVIDLGSVLYIRKYDTYYRIVFKHDELMITVESDTPEYDALVSLIQEKL